MQEQHPIDAFDTPAKTDKPDTLETQLRRIEAAKTGSYVKRTEHLDAAGKTLFINRLIREDSPYLLQHAHNPVNWYAWGTEAFATAQREHKPIFLSIGYSTCHWCHVMEVESFDNVAVATLLNQHFISIKLDREQFPDIDEVYMTGVQIMSGQGGWPMSNFLLADGKPFFGATYFPAAGFTHVLKQVVDAWQHKYAEMESSAVQISAAIDRYLSARQPATALSSQLEESMLQALLQREDRSYGGLAGAPKFPQEPLLLLMLDRVRRKRELQTLAFVERALEGMASGGIYDQVAGGFHRYSVDAEWLVPHFEKMLYNQSQLGLVYLQAWQLSQNHCLRRVCEQTLNYVVRDMQIPEGGFYSATDADSEGEEGTFFVWSLAQLEAVLTADEMQLARHVYDISASGNFEGGNILSLRKNLAQLATSSGRTDFYPALDAVLRKLFAARAQRLHPLRDDKLIVAWTGAMVTTLARAAYALANTDWLAAAERAVQLVWSKNVELSAQGLHCRRIYLDGAVSINGQLEDYVNLVEALLALFDITSKTVYLQQARAIFAAALTEFWDGDSGSFYLSPQQLAGPQLTRSRSATDGATLSAVATALQCLISLQQRSAIIDQANTSLRDDLEPKIHACFTALSGAVNENPMSHPSVLRALARQQRGSIDNIQFAGNGRARLAVRTQARDDTQVQFQITLTLQEGWHVTAPSADTAANDFVPLQIRVEAGEAHWQLDSCEFPATEKQLQNPDGTTVPIYSGAVAITAKFARTTQPADALSNSIGFQIRVQLCDEKHCLLPEDLFFRS